MHMLFTESWNYFLFTFVTFLTFNIDFFHASILWKCKCSRYLVNATPLTVLYHSHWKYTDVLTIVWKYAYAFYRILKLLFVYFCHIFNLDFFHASILWKCICSMYLVSATPLTVLYHSHWNYTDVLTIVWRYAYAFYRILKLPFFLTFFTF